MHFSILCLSSSAFCALHTYQVSLKDNPIRGSPFAVYCAPGPLAIEEAKPYGPGLRGAAYNQPTSFNVEVNRCSLIILWLASLHFANQRSFCWQQVRDKYHNIPSPKDLSADDLSVSIKRKRHPEGGHLEKQTDDDKPKSSNGFKNEQVRDIQQGQEEPQPGINIIVECRVGYFHVSYQINRQETVPNSPLSFLIVTTFLIIITILHTHTHTQGDQTLNHREEYLLDVRLQGHPVCRSPFIVALEDPSTPAAVSLGSLAPSEASASSTFCCSMQSGETWPTAAALDVSTVFQGLRIGGGAAAAKPRCKKRGKPSTSTSTTTPALHLFGDALPVAPSLFALSSLTSSEEPHNNHDDDGGVFVFGASHN